MSSSPDETSLSDVQLSLSLFAEAIAAHPVAFETTDEGWQCWPAQPSDPSRQTVMLPSHGESRLSYRAKVLQQVLAAPLDLQAGDPAGLADVYAVVEDHRVHWLTRHNYPGAAAQLDVELGRAVAGRVAAPGSRSLLEVVRDYTLGIDVGVGGLVEPALAIVDRVMAPESTASESRAVALELLGLLSDLSTRQGSFLEGVETADDDPAVPSEGPTSVSLDGGTPSEFADGSDLGGGQLLTQETADTPTAARPPDDEPLRLGLQLPLSAGAGGSDHSRRTYVYDEWDYHDQQHRRAWCRVIEEQTSGEDMSYVQDVRRRYPQLRSQLRRALLQLRNEDLVRVHRSSDGDELDIDAVIEARVDRRSGAPADERLHIRRDRAARDVATAFLLDLSASTSSPAVPPEPEPMPETDPMDDPLSYGPIWDSPPPVAPVRRVLDVAKDAVALMGDVLHELGDRFAIYGFSGSGRDQVEFKVGMDFTDRVSPQSWAAVEAMKPLRYTRMGPAVRHAAMKLGAEPARTRLLVVVSDGYPQDVDYGRDRHDRDYGIHDTARALADANAAGIETLCVTIDPAGHDYLRIMCPDERYVVIEDVETLPTELAACYLGRFRPVTRVEATPTA